MKGIAFLSGLISSLLTSGIVLPAAAQVTSDNTNNTTVNQSNNNFNIINGIEKGNNLFHSFKEFSIPTGGSAVFDNSTSVVNIINRVTGGNISNIDGLIKANGNANLFLINPAGIVFGENASLKIGGSFLGSTAESVLFADGFEFSAVNPQSTALLKVTVPLGLQMGQNSGVIEVRGTGHRLIGGGFTPVVRNLTQSTLQVNSGKAIALVGKSVNLSGAVLTAENGRIELGGVQAGIVDLSYTSTEFQLDYGKIESFGDIQLVKQSLLDASGLTSGGIQLQGQNISFKDASNVLIQTLGSQAPNRIKVRAAGDLNLSGDVRIAPDMGMILGTTPVRFTTETLGSEKGADIDISARNLDLDEGGIFQSRTFSGASGGNITVNVAENIQINRSAPLNPSSLSGIAAATLSPGKSGNISVIASNINITNGGTISANNFGQGDSGNVDVNVSGTIKLIGVEPSLLSPSSIGSNALQQGDGGSVTVNTSKLIAEDGAFVNSATFNSGNGGQITVNASESIEVRGGSPGLFSSISASAPIAPEVFRQVAGIPDRPSGNSGSLTINTPKLRIDDGGEVAVNNNGTGNGGDLSINSNSILVNNAGKIIANTASGKGGNISLNLQESLIFRNNSFINTESLGTGNGGNISVNSPVLAGFENSDIIANAIEGNGGNIDITTQGIFGLEFRDELTEESDITASSKFGVNGTVAINNIGIDPGFGLVELPVELSDSSQQIAQGCLNNKGSNFVITGKGGIPYSPNQHLISNQTWYDIRNFSTSRKPSNNIETTQISNKAAIVEATGFIRNQNGEIEFVSSESKPFSTEKVINCSGLST